MCGDCHAVFSHVCLVVCLRACVCKSVCERDHLVFVCVYWSVVFFATQVRVATGLAGLSYFRADQSKDEQALINTPHSNMCSDQGSDMVSAVHGLLYFKDIKQ